MRNILSKWFPRKSDDAVRLTCDSPFSISACENGLTRRYTCKNSLSKQLESCTQTNDTNRDKHPDNMYECTRATTPRWAKVRMRTHLSCCHFSQIEAQISPQVVYQDGFGPGHLIVKAWLHHGAEIQKKRDLHLHTLTPHLRPEVTLM